MSVTQTQTYTIKLNKKEQEQKDTKKEKKAPHRRVTWTEDTVNNEHMNRKKSNSDIISLLYLSSTSRSM